MYIINLAGFKRLTVAGGIAILIITKLLHLNTEAGTPWNALGPGFFFGFITAFVLTWTAITTHAKKVESSDILRLKTRDD